jgi:hypothetical protein
MAIAIKGFEFIVREGGGEETIVRAPPAAQSLRDIRKKH